MHHELIKQNNLWHLGAAFLFGIVIASLFFLLPSSGVQGKLARNEQAKVNINSEKTFEDLKFKMDGMYTYLVNILHPYNGQLSIRLNDLEAKMNELDERLDVELPSDVEDHVSVKR